MCYNTKAINTQIFRGNISVTAVYAIPIICRRILTTAQSRARIAPQPAGMD